jgi:hypothetical protein
MMKTEYTEKENRMYRTEKHDIQNSSPPPPPLRKKHGKAVRVAEECQLAR